MMYTLIGMSLLFIAIGFIVTVNNAKYLLAGYNTMSKAEQDQVDIKTYITYFRKFHLFLGTSFFLIGMLLIYSGFENETSIFIVAYPLLAYIYFIATSTKYFNAKKNKIGLLLLAIGLIFIVVMFIRDFKETKLILNSNSIEFKGDYGETVPFEKIKSIQLVHEKLKIVQRINGFSAGTIKKGIYKTDTGEKIKLIINAENKAYILITKSDGKKIYYSSKEESNEELFAIIEKARKN